MHALRAARQIKHLGFVSAKRGRGWVREAKFAVGTVVFRNFERVHPYRYRPERYADTFLASTKTSPGVSRLPRRVFALWTGENDLSANRSNSLHEIEERIGLPLVLVTPDTLDEWVLPDFPLHRAYEHLSLIHRSDYLRGYLMHHHGGAYVDIKRPLGSWQTSFERLADDPESWVVSYSSTHANWIGKYRGRLGRDILIHYRIMFGKSGFIMRSHTPITAEWIAEMDHRLDAAYDALRRQPGGVYGDHPDYPLSWTDLLGRVLDPLTLKYLPHVRFDDQMLLDFNNYR